jgi:hypothetical protein
MPSWFCWCAVVGATILTQATFSTLGGTMANISGPDFITIVVSDLKISYSFYTEKIGLRESAEKRPNARAFHAKPCGFAIRQSADDRKIENPGQGIILWWRTADATALHRAFKKREFLLSENCVRARSA